jgi:glycosyltransferase involved in cell wall biosynthesis
MKISVIIITHNRLEDLKRTIPAFLSQSYENKEIILVDNASTDGTPQWIKEEYPFVKYLWLPDNFDIRAINIGIEMSDGDIIWRTDDDSYPENQNTFERIVEIFEQHNDIDIIATEDVEVRQNYRVWEWYPLNVDKSNVPEKGFQSNVFPGTGAAIRRKVYDKIGGFWEFGFEELDFCTRAIVAGFNVRYFPNIRTLHWASPGGRQSGTRWVKVSKQFIRYHWRYFPFAQALGRSFQIYFFQLTVALLQRIPISAFFEGAFGMLATMFGTYRDERSVVPKEKIKDITLGVTIGRNQRKYFADVIKKKLGKWFRKS